MLKAIIFDMDGVLIDSVKYIWRSFDSLLRDQGVSFTDDYIKKNLSRSLRDNLISWKKEFDIKDYDILEFSKKSGKIQLELMKNEKPEIGLIDLLEQAKKMNIKCAVATSSLRWRAEAILDLLKLRNYFEVLVTAEDVIKHKPDPEVFIEAARRVGVNPEECVVIEDAENGVKTAKNGNMKAIGFLTKYHSRNELSHADLVVSNFNELTLERLNRLF